MKYIKKLILPLLIIALVFLIYQFYFSGATGLGSFSDFDPNNNAIKPIIVQLVKERGINQEGGSIVFFAADKNGRVEKIYGEFSLPTGFDNADIITLKGHLTQSGFHAHEVSLE